MSAVRLSGKELAANLRAEAAGVVAELAADGVAARLAIVTATGDESAAWYVRSLLAAAGRIGMRCTVTDLGPDAGADQIRQELTSVSADPAVHGIILQTPLPAGLRAAELALAIDPSKDVDGANPVSLGRLTAGLRGRSSPPGPPARRRRSAPLAS